MAQTKTAKTGGATTAKAPKRSTSRTVSRAPAVKSRPASESPAPETSPSFKRNDLLSAVAARSALPKSDLRAVIELVLDEMGQALSSGKDLALPPLGRVKVQRRKDTDGAEVLTLRLRRKSELEEAADAS